jgi:hypothetical protein
MEAAKRNELLTIVQDNDRAFVDRGKAIDELVRSGTSQAEIANSTNLSTSAISHLKTCFLNLKGKAREMCQAGKINGDACYSLACAPEDDQERIVLRAIERRRIKDSERSVRRKCSKGRQTRPGQITDKDMKEAINNITHHKENQTTAVPTTGSSYGPGPKSTNSCYVLLPTKQTLAFAGRFINLSEISRKQGIDTSYLSRIFNGQRMPTVPYIRKIGNALEMQIQEFLDALDAHLKR